MVERLSKEVVATLIEAASSVATNMESVDGVEINNTSGMLRASLKLKDGSLMTLMLFAAPSEVAGRSA